MTKSFFGYLYLSVGYCTVPDAESVVLAFAYTSFYVSYFETYVPIVYCILLYLIRTVILPMFASLNCILVR